MFFSNANEQTIGVGCKPLAAIRHLTSIGLRSLPALVLAFAATSVAAQDTLRIVSPFPPGGPVDGLARILATGLSEKYKLPALVENLTGAAGNIGMDRVKKAAPDGRTLLVIPAGNLTINPTLMKAFPFNIEQDFVPIAMLAKAPNVLVANAAVPVSNVRDLIALSKSKPNSLSFASPGVGSGLHLAGELFNAQAGTDLLHVPYKGSPPAINDLLGGAVPLMFSNLPTVLPHIQSGKLKAIGITDSVRTASSPEIPTLQEQGISGVVVTSWYALLAPRGTAPAMALQLSKDAAEILNRPAIRDQLKAQALAVWSMNPDELRGHMKAETASWARIIKAKNITTD